jgi:hypothetical protein
MLKAFLDDSGKAEEHPVVVVAGFLGTTSMWDQFDVRWRAFLDQFGIRRFHIT